jgi:hypothetical protein
MNNDDVLSLAEEYAVARGIPVTFFEPYFVTETDIARQDDSEAEELMKRIWGHWVGNWVVMANEGPKHFLGVVIQEPTGQVQPIIYPWWMRASLSLYLWFESLLGR